jgi:glycine/D-amino acid oxidase-like deaminating enzyme
MAIVVIGGQARNVGKTSVVCGLISALPERCWTAIKISQHGHGVAVLEERDATTGTDSARYLAAGAARAFWISADEGELAAAMPYVRAAMKGAENVILESNSVLEFVRPDLYAVVLAPAMADFKASALRYLERANAVLVLGKSGAQSDWKGVSLPGIERIRTFSIESPNYCSAEFTAFVEQRLERVGR